jgi:hypothetical protein
MKVAYSAVGISERKERILGHVVFDSALAAQPAGGLVYSVLAYTFYCGNLIFSAGGNGQIAPVGQIRIPFGNPPPDLVDVGNASWTMGAWHAGVGILFKGVDNVNFGPNAEGYRHLPPRMEMDCDGPGAPPTGVPFYPIHWLKLTWNPQFVLAKVVNSAYFDTSQN